MRFSPHCVVKLCKLYDCCVSNQKEKKKIDELYENGYSNSQVEYELTCHRKNKTIRTKDKQLYTKDKQLYTKDEQLYTKHINKLNTE